MSSLFLSPHSVFPFLSWWEYTSTSIVICFMTLLFRGESNQGLSIRYRYPVPFI
ncbi:hypothetical protein BDV30DRAFT_217836 [Aspergillus minisclerotigenes]|uniref:Uncharacterized protein n=1 Tax=Aspergillus minisclerotigenes TaxID=656917 RepID=A0A5N6ISA1_9EURO|nr:hypothetical protein BDV30DRAFT_217836 [Aspergillus minisclerotigenes]